jgi:hypothetical protein
VADDFLAQVREMTAALNRGEFSRAKQILRDSRLIERLEANDLPDGPAGKEAKAAVERLLVLALEHEANASKKLLGAYGKR